MKDAVLALRSPDGEAEDGQLYRIRLTLFLSSQFSSKRDLMPEMASIKFDDGNTNSGSQVGVNNGVINVQTGKLPTDCTTQIRLINRSRTTGAPPKPSIDRAVPT